MIKKKCSQCGETKILNKFSINKDGKYGYHSVCKFCKNNSKRIKEMHKIYVKNRSKEDPRFRLNRNIGILIWQSIKQNKGDSYWENLIGYTLRELITHLEKQFKTGMSWNNYGRRGWTIDHKKPISSFNFNSCSDPEFKQCWSLENLQPLWASENISKGTKLIK